jgi:hypothetical protein
MVKFSLKLRLKGAKNDAQFLIKVAVSYCPRSPAMKDFWVIFVFYSGIDCMLMYWDSGWLSGCLRFELVAGSIVCKRWVCIRITEAWIFFNSLWVRCVVRSDHCSGSCHALSVCTCRGGGVAIHGLHGLHKGPRVVLGYPKHSHPKSSCM